MGENPRSFCLPTLCMIIKLSVLEPIPLNNTLTCQLQMQYLLITKVARNTVFIINFQHRDGLPIFPPIFLHITFTSLPHVESDRDRNMANICVAFISTCKCGLCSHVHSVHSNACVFLIPFTAMLRVSRHGNRVFVQAPLRFISIRKIDLWREERKDW